MSAKMAHSSASIDHDLREEIANAGEPARLTNWPTPRDALSRVSEYCSGEGSGVQRQFRGGQKNTPRDAVRNRRQQQSRGAGTDVPAPQNAVAGGPLRG
jgi:hypothetical protein